MNVEYEATFSKIDKGTIRRSLEDAGAELIENEFLQKRAVFLFPKGHEDSASWIRVRDEKDRITMSVKTVDGKKIDNQKEMQIEVSGFDQAVAFLELLGCKKKAYQETKRELWTLDGVEISIDEWPFLEPFLEIEGESEEEVKKVSEKLGLDYSKALFCSVDTLYSEKYHISKDTINNKTPLIVFEGDNPFIKNE